MNLYFVLGMMGPWQIVLIILALVLLFGGRKIPELMKGIGQGMKEFKNATQSEEDKDKENPEKIERDRKEKS